MPPCNCHPPFPRPEPFSPLPRPGKVPDWGQWIRDRLAEKGALLVFPTRASFPNPGAWPNLYLDLETGAIYRWDREDYSVLVDPREGDDVLVYDSVAAFPDEGEQGKLYIAANTGSLYRWGGGGYVALLPGKADKAVPQTAGNFAALTQDGNLADSGKKPADYYTTEQVNEAIDKLAAYYITADAQGNPFATHAALVNAQTYYSGGAVRTPTRNDYAVVSADEMHGGAEWRYIYAVDAQGAGQWEPQYAVEGVIAYDNTVTRTSENGVKSSGIWSALWGTASTAFTSLYDWCVAQLGLKRDYTDLSYDTTETVEVPALHATMTSQQGGQVIVEYDLLCTEEVPDPPQVGHSYTWKADGAAFYVTQGVSALQTTWVLYSYTDEPLGGVTTQNATQGFYPDVEFRPSYAVITIHKTTAQKTVTVEDELALKSDIPAPSTATPAMDGTGAAGTSAAFARGDHVHPTDTSRVPTSRTVNGKALSSDVELDADDVGAYPATDTEGEYESDKNLYVNGRTRGEHVQARSPSDYTDWCDVATLLHIAAEFDPQDQYAQNALVTFREGDNWKLYKCVAANGHTGNWNPNDFQEATVEGILAALRTGKQNALSAQQLANIAAVSDALAFDATHSYAAGDPVVYNGTLYTFTAAHTGAWTGSDVSAVDIIARLAGKLDKSGGTVGTIRVYEAGDYGGNVIIASDYGTATITPDGITFNNGRALMFPQTQGIGTLALTADLNAKLDSTSAAPAFSSDSSVSYPVGSHCTYNGKLYRCTTATTGGTWVAGSWTADTMTDPDAVLDISSQNQLRVVAKDGTLLWAQGYDLASTSSATLACDAANNFTFADGATTQAFALPTAPTGKVGDFGLDIDNSANTSAATMTLTGLDTAFSVVVPEGESLNDMLSIAAGELARFYISLSTFRINNLPTWHIVKQVVENGGAQS